MRKEADRFKSPQHLAKFLIGMACNKAKMEVRRQLHSKKHDLGREVPLNHSLGEDGREIPSREPGPVDVAIARERWERILQAQPECHRRIIPLRLQGHTHAEIATILDISEPIVYRVLKKLLRTTDE